MNTYLLTFKSILNHRSIPRLPSGWNKHVHTLMELYCEDRTPFVAENDTELFMGPFFVPILYYTPVTKATAISKPTDPNRALISAEVKSTEVYTLSLLFPRPFLRTNKIYALKKFNLVYWKKFEA